VRSRLAKPQIGISKKKKVREPKSGTDPRTYNQAGLRSIFVVGKEVNKAQTTREQ
jgi:hypothetical protein